MRYADEDTVYRRLEIDPLVDLDDAAEADMVEAGIADAIDGVIGRTYGDGQVSATRDIAYRRYPVRYSTYWPEFAFVPNAYSALYVLPYGVKDVTAVSAGGEWDGTIWTNEDVLTADEWRLVYQRRDGYYQGIVVVADYDHSIRVTGRWEDLGGADAIPADIREVATFLTVDEYRIRHQSPAGEIGPPGLSVFLRNAWEFTFVKQTLAKHRLHPMVV